MSSLNMADVKQKILVKKFESGFFWDLKLQKKTWDVP
jgi:hypothetical protein